MIGTVGVRAYHAMDDAKAVANRFLSAVEQGDAGGAQDLLCGEASPDLVQRVMSAGIVSHHVTGVQVQSGFGSRRSAGTTATVLVDLTDAAGQHPSDVEVVHELGVWLVCDVGRFGALPAR
ncbi:MAG: hypothetical protein QOI82_932 [Actinomycetota bacterium]|nr:hypothetical protein [Actinomycetota bacterium]